MLHFIDKDFNKDFTRHYSLLFQLEEQQYAYAVYEKRTGKLQVLKSVQLNSASSGDILTKLKNSVTSDDILQAPYHEVKVGLVASPFSFVPRVLFEEEKAAAYLKITAETSQADVVHTNNVKGVFAKNIFSVDQSIHQYLHEVFDRPKLFHCVSGLIETAIRVKDNFADQQIVLDIKPGIMHIAYFEKRDFKFNNQYRYVNKEDFLYYVLLVADQFMIDRNTCDLKLSGEIVPDSMLFGELWKFFKNISFLQMGETIATPDELKEKPLYIHNTLLSLDLCE